MQQHTDRLFLSTGKVSKKKHTPIGRNQSKYRTRGNSTKPEARLPEFVPDPLWLTCFVALSTVNVLCLNFLTCKMG